jgi:hypothetical protein
MEAVSVPALAAPIQEQDGAETPGEKAAGEEKGAKHKAKAA